MRAADTLSMLAFGNGNGRPRRLSLDRQGNGVLSKRERNSLSGLDERKSGPIRDSIYRYMIAHPPSSSPADTKSEGDPNRTRNNRR